MSRLVKILVTFAAPRDALLRHMNLDDDVTVELVAFDEVHGSRETLLEMAKEVDGILCTPQTRIDKQVIEQAGSKLKIISTHSVGYEHIDLEECAKRHVRIGYTPDVLNDATAELTIGLLLSVARRINEGAELIKAGKWTSFMGRTLLGRGISGSVVGIFGLGRIGMAIATRLKAFSPSKIIYNSRRPKPEAAEQHGFEYVSFDELLEQSDFVICISALTKETERVFNMSAFNKMKPSAIFVNVARGALVDQNDLCRALKSKIIGGAGLDVTTPEPLPADHELLTLDNCVITPHIGSAEYKTRDTMLRVAAGNLAKGLKNEHLLYELNLN